MITFSTKKFIELSTTELYQLLKIRAEVFVVEQNCAYLDVDNYDLGALHILGTRNNEIVAYARLLPQGYYHKEAGIGRVVTSASARTLGYGKLLMEYAITETLIQFKTNEIVISAQLYLEKFYTNLGFKTEGEPYLEDDIPHIKMRYLNTI
jgi:ElaA protein